MRLFLGWQDGKWIMWHPVWGENREDFVLHYTFWGLGVMRKVLYITRYTLFANSRKKWTNRWKCYETRIVCRAFSLTFRKQVFRSAFCAVFAQWSSLGTKHKNEFACCCKHCRRWWIVWRHIFTMFPKFQIFLRKSGFVVVRVVCSGLMSERLRRVHSNALFF